MKDGGVPLGLKPAIVLMGLSARLKPPQRLRPVGLGSCSPTLRQKEIERMGTESLWLVESGRVGFVLSRVPPPRRTRDPGRPHLR